MRAVRVVACLVAVFAVGLLAAASALATPEYDAAKYPQETKGAATNDQGFNGGGVVIVCPEATFNTNEEIGNDPEAEAKNTIANATTLVEHPNYGNAPLTTPCKGTIAASTFQVEVKSKFCNYKTKAAKPGEKTGELSIICEKLALAGSEVTEKSTLVKVSSTAKLQEKFTVTGTKIPANDTITKVNSATEIEIGPLPVEGTGIGKVSEALTFKSPGIENVFIGLTGCTVTVFPQTVKGLEYKNEPKAGTAEQEVTTAAEVKEIKSKATGGCSLGVGEAEFKAEYRKGKIKTTIPEAAEIEPEGNPALTVAHAVEPGTAVPIASEVGSNEAHWYKNKGLIPASAEGIKFLMWGAMTFGSTAMTGTCQTLWGGNVMNTQGGGPPPGGGSAVAGETKIAGVSAYDCAESMVCEGTDASKLFVEPEGLGVVVKEGKAEPLTWNGALSGTAPTVNIGNETKGSPTQIKLKLVCPKTTGGEYAKSWVGEQKTRTSEGFVGATSIGSSPSILRFGAGSGTLEIVGTSEKGEVTATNMKMMGFEGGEEITTKNP
jgi:hypothetical protein